MLNLRLCLVSNSSASSFVVAFDRVPDSWSILYDLIFQDKSTTTVLYSPRWEDFPVEVGKEEIINFLWRRTKSQSASFDEMREVIRLMDFGIKEEPALFDKNCRSLLDEIFRLEKEFITLYGLVYGVPDFYRLRKLFGKSDHPRIEQLQRKWKKYKFICDRVDENYYAKLCKFSTAEVRKFIKQNRGKFFAVYKRYADYEMNYAESFIKDGLCFNHLPHIKVDTH